MTGSTDDIMKGFPHQIIPKIIGEPTFDLLQDIHRKLSANAASVPTTLGGGAHGYLGMTTPGNTYFALTGALFQPPNDPGPLPQIPPNATAAQIGNIERTHKEAKRLYQEYVAVGNALKQQLISAIDETYLRGLRNNIYGYMNVSVLQMITYLYENYGDIEPGDLSENNKRFTNPYDASTPIETLWEQIEEAIAFAAAAEAPYTTQQIINNTYDLLHKTGQFKDELKEWRRLPTAQQTWPLFKRMMTRAHRDLRRQVAASTGYHTANNLEYGRYDNDTSNAMAATAAALEELAEATQNDRVAVANLTTANNTLTNQVKTINELKTMIKDLAQEVKTLKNSIKAIQLSKPNIRTNSNNNNDTNNSEEQPRVFKRVQTKWCWSCGVNRGHTSERCKYQAPGHQVNATPNNMMGSNPFGMHHSS